MVDTKTLRILVSNDDGINAPGLKIAYAIARSLTDDVWVVAPETDQSGVSHSLTLSHPLRLREVSERHWAVTGTPTDCVLLAIDDVLADRKPDLVISGVNRGANMGEDVTYSGTVAAAMEGTLIGIPSIALSQQSSHDARDHIRWAVAETHAPAVIRRLLETGWPKDVLINVNFPDCDPAEVKGLKTAHQGKRAASTAFFDRRVDARGNSYYWLGFRRDDKEGQAPGSDIAAVLSDLITVTPLHLDLTHYETLHKLDEAFGDFAVARIP